jgi:hypothetical protein
MYSFGFQHAFESGIQPIDNFFFSKVRTVLFEKVCALRRVLVFRVCEDCCLAHDREFGSEWVYAVFA